MGVANRMTSCFGLCQELTLQKPVWNVLLIFSSQGLLQKSKVAEHSYEEGYQRGWNEARILQIELNTRYRKYKELMQKSCFKTCIDRLCLEILPLQILVISEEVSK